MTNVLLVAAHPDDETIGASTLLAGAAAIVHVTDGAPRDMSDALRHGFGTREDYARARRAEFEQALHIALWGAGSQPAAVSQTACPDDSLRPKTIHLGIPDQEASLCIPEIAARLRDIISRIRPDCLLTHPYEGGHPDHDACAAAVRRAAGDLPVWEFAGYHMGPGGIRTGEFLTGDGAVQTVVLNHGQRLRKQRMFECYRTQRDVLQYFTVGNERFRPAPKYDFTRPPHEGTLFYEQFPWGMTGERFRALAAP